MTTSDEFLENIPLDFYDTEVVKRVGTPHGLTLEMRLDLHRSLEGPLPEWHPEYGCCWPWTGSLDTKGRGQIRVGQGTKRAYQVAFMLRSGFYPSRGKAVCHTCDNPLCTRNDGEESTYEVRGVLLPRFGHLWLGTQTQNMADMTDKGRRNIDGPGLVGELHHAAEQTEQRVRAMRLLRADGWSLENLARLFETNIYNVSQICRGRTWRTDGAGEPVSTELTKARGARHGAAKFHSDEAVRAVLRRIAAGESQDSIARSLGVTQPTISMIANGKRWGHVTLDPP